MYQGKPDIHLVEYGNLTKGIYQLLQENICCAYGNNVLFLLLHVLHLIYAINLNLLSCVGFLRAGSFLTVHSCTYFTLGRSGTRGQTILSALCTFSLHMSQPVLPHCSEMIKTRWGSSGLALPSCFLSLGAKS